jgi:hypothetical protein
MTLPPSDRHEQPALVTTRRYGAPHEPIRLVEVPADRRAADDATADARLLATIATARARVLAARTMLERRLEELRQALARVQV